MVFQEDLVAIATDKYGSHVIDKIWSQSDEEGRNIVEQELSRHRSLLKGSMYGRIILRNCGLESVQPQTISKQNDASETVPEFVVHPASKKTQKSVPKEEVQKETKPAKRKRSEVPQGSAYIKELASLGVGVKDTGMSDMDKYTKMSDGIEDLGQQVRNCSIHVFLNCLILKFMVI